MRREDLTQDELKAILHYDPETGEFTWLQCLSNRSPAGSRAGTIGNHGYVVIRIHRWGHLAHRIAWLYMYGSWPVAEIDHTNGVRHDNRLDNLRAATRLQNAQNVGRRKSSASGIKGVHWDNQNRAWKACLRRPDGTRFRRDFHTKEQAAAAYREEVARVHGQFARFE